VDAEGRQLGVVDTSKALTMARNQRLDLVEVAPDSSPPVCRIMNYGRFRYEQSKKERLARKHQVAVRFKELKFHSSIDPHDFGVKQRHAREFLSKGMKVKASLWLRGREMAHPERGM